MKIVKLFLPIFIILSFLGRTKVAGYQQIIPISNGDFELWDSMPNLYNWQTNSCPACMPPYETYIVQKVTDASHGQFAAKFIYNMVYSSWAKNKFPVSLHPNLMTADIKANITNGDTANIRVDLFSGNNIVDSGNFDLTSSITSYKKIAISISQISSTVDSAFIKIVGGKKQGSEIYVDNLQFMKSN